MKHLFLTVLMLSASYMNAVADNTDAEPVKSEDSSGNALSNDVKSPVKRTFARRTINVSYENGVLSIATYNTYNEISILVCNSETGEEYECCTNLLDGDAHFYLNLPAGNYSIEIQGDSLNYSSSFTIEQD